MYCLSLRLVCVCLFLVTLRSLLSAQSEAQSPESLPTRTISPVPDLYAAAEEAVTGPEDHSLAARAVYTVRNDGEEPLHILSLYLRHPLRFTEVTVGDRPARGRMSPGTLGGLPAARLELELVTPLPPGQSRQIAYAWTTSYARHPFGRKPIGFAPERGFILCESGWYPHTSTTFSMFSYQMEIAAPPGCLALTSGELADRRSSATGEVFSYDCAIPSLPYLVWGRYRISTAEIGGARVEIWTPSSGAIEPEPMRACLAEVLALYDRLLPPTVVTGHRIVAVTRFGGYGPAGTLLLQDTYFDPEALTRAESVDLVAHELAHSWVNAIARPAGDLMLSLSEGIATFFGARAVEEVVGSEAAREIWAGRRDEYQPLFRRTVAPIELTERIQHADNAMFRAVTYTKSCFFLREMETLLGEEAFFAALHAALEDHRGGEFTFDDLAAALARTGGEEVRECYRRYAEERDLPDYVVLPTADEPGTGSLVLENRGAPCPVPVRVVGCEADVWKIVIFSIN